MAVQKNMGTAGGEPKTRGTSSRNTAGGNPRQSSGTKAPAGKNKKNSKKPWGIIFWAAFFIVIFILFFVNRASIVKTFEDTRFFERIMNRQVTGAEDPPPFQPSLPDNPQSAESSGAPAGDNEGGLAETAPEIKIADPLREGSEGGPPGEGEDIAEETPPAAGEPETSAAARAAPQQSPELRERGLYFIMIDPEGDIVRIKVTRQLPLSDSPMLDVLNSLTAGPNREEQNRGLVSLIPGNSRILNATVRGSTAYISFSEEFQYNPHGVEGYAASLRQIIWTVTEFSNVKDVQILVEGRRVDYLGEGIWIGSPINRTF